MAGGGVERIGAVFRGTIAKPWRIPRKQGQLRGFSDQPVAEIVQCGEPAPNAHRINHLRIQPFWCFELPQANSLILRR